MQRRLFCGLPRIFDAPVRLARIAIEHATMYENLLRQAQHDPLTGLPNRLRLEECLELAIRDCDASERKLAIFYIDLDRFKEINDTLSHQGGRSLPAGNRRTHESGGAQRRHCRADRRR